MVLQDVDRRNHPPRKHQRNQEGVEKESGTAEESTGAKVRKAKINVDMSILRIGRPRTVRLLLTGSWAPSAMVKKNARC